MSRETGVISPGSSEMMPAVFDVDRDGALGCVERLDRQSLCHIDLPIASPAYSAAILALAGPHDFTTGSTSLAKSLRLRSDTS